MGIIPSYVQNFCSLWLLWPPHKVGSYGRCWQGHSEMVSVGIAPFLAQILAFGHVAPSHDQVVPGLWYWGLCQGQSLFHTHVNVDIMKAKVKEESAVML